MLLYGTCNPRGEDDAYNGLYLTQKEIRDAVDDRSLIGVPVKTEHKGGGVGKIVSVNVGNNGDLMCLLEIDESSMIGSLAGGFVRDGLATELSLGYTVDVKNTQNHLKAIKKQVHEVSIVRKGARKGCYIVALEGDGRTQFKNCCWGGYFNMD